MAKLTKRDVNKATGAAVTHPTPAGVREVAKIIGPAATVEALKDVSQRISTQANKLANGNHQVKNRDKIVTPKADVHVAPKLK